jgi:hypothetical protein
VNTPIRWRAFFPADALIEDLQGERTDAVIAEVVSARSRPLQLIDAAAGESMRQVMARE